MYILPLSTFQVPTSSDRLRREKRCMGFNIERLPTRVNGATNTNVYAVKCTLLHSDDTRDALVCLGLCLCAVYGGNSWSVRKDPQVIGKRVSGYVDVAPHVTSARL